MTSSELTIAASGNPLTVALPELASAAAYASKGSAENTVRAYKADWATFSAWCEGRGVPSLPASPEVVAAYLASLADACKKASTIERALVAIGFVHRAKGHEWGKAHPVVREVMKGIRRTLGVAPAKKSPVTDDELRAIVGTCGEDERGLRDRALVLLGWFGALRRSELVALEVGDVARVREGLLITVRRSKTDQEGHGIVKAIPYASDPALCPVRALDAWLSAGSIFEGRIFDLSDKAVARIVKGHAKAAGLDASIFGGHSLRAGFATTAAKKGRSLDAIMRQTGHRSERVARGYIRHATAFEGNAAVGLV